MQTKLEQILKQLKAANSWQNKISFTPRLGVVLNAQIIQTAAKQARRQGLFVQTHLSETKEEIRHVLANFREQIGLQDVENYTQAYDRLGLLTNKTLLAHCIHVDDSELQLIARRKAKIIHCPSSNAPTSRLGLGSGWFDFRRADQLGIDWALGSDIGGGPYLCMLDVITSFVAEAAVQGAEKQATFCYGLYRATLAGAKILGRSKDIGNLSVGKEANFLILPFSPSRHSQSAESILRSLLLPYRKRRSRFPELILQPVYRSHFLGLPQ